MSKFRTYSANNKLFNIYVKHINLFYYSFWLIYMLSLVSINKSFIDFVDNLYISIATALVFFALAYYIRKKQKKILKALESNGELEFLQTKLNLTTDNKSETVDKNTINKIKIIKKLAKGINSSGYKYNLIRIETKDNKNKELLIDTYSFDKKPFELLDTLSFFAKYNKLKLERK